MWGLSPLMALLLIRQQHGTSVHRNFAVPHSPTWTAPVFYSTFLTISIIDRVYLYARLIWYSLVEGYSRDGRVIVATVLFCLWVATHLGTVFRTCSRLTRLETRSMEFNEVASQIGYYSRPKLSWRTLTRLAAAIPLSFILFARIWLYVYVLYIVIER